MQREATGYKKSNTRYLVAMDSFKGSLTSMEAGNAVKEGILKADPEAEVKICPLADGDEGTVRTLTSSMDGEFCYVTVHDPLGNEITCEYGIIPQKGETEACAVIEIAGACGLYLVPDNRRDPMYTTTFGVGEVILDAFSKGCRRFIIGIGGSSTNDGGVGMLETLGVHFIDELGNPIKRGAIGLEALNGIDLSLFSGKFDGCSFMIACDVDNPLCGDRGCSNVFARQKGADDEAVAKMDKWLLHYAELTGQTFDRLGIPGVVNMDYPGAGAAGGLGFAFKTFLRAELLSGIDLVIRETGISEYLREADIVITGEGCIDGQTAMGKAPVGLARAVKMFDNKKKVVAFAGKIGDGADKCKAHGIDEYYGITDYVKYLDASLYMDRNNAYDNLVALAERYVSSNA